MITQNEMLQAFDVELLDFEMRCNPYAIWVVAISEQLVGDEEVVMLFSRDIDPSDGTPGLLKYSDPRLDDEVVAVAIAECKAEAEAQYNFNRFMPINPIGA